MPADPTVARLRRAPGVLWRAGPFGVVLLAPGAQDPCTLAGTGPALWEELAVPGDGAALATRLAARFGADPARVRADLEPVLAELLALGAIEEAA